MVRVWPGEEGQAGRALEPESVPISVRTYSWGTAYGIVSLNNGNIWRGVDCCYGPQAGLELHVVEHFAIVGIGNPFKFRDLNDRLIRSAEWPRNRKQESAGNLENLENFSC